MIACVVMALCSYLENKKTGSRRVEINQVNKFVYKVLLGKFSLEIFTMFV